MKSETWRDLPDAENLSGDDVFGEVYKRLTAATIEAVSTYTITKYFPKLW